ncbi:DUF3817 domain-containing protein [Chryseobacterium sp. 3008163]|uniref:DUF3817 domain-containing protein n=1 Tax=Chryseobacterium sp. 3008163 TaxID=2478663 RepID=UPI000F0C6AE3|nr:DUF3817 domain-containing protein [Chryseobacterium sp. 3008163]
MINLYRKTALVEGISYLILLFIAIPLKYFRWIHGILFQLFFVCLVIPSVKYR